MYQGRLVVNVNCVQTKVGPALVMLRTEESLLRLDWAATWQNQQFDCAPSEDSDQTGRMAKTQISLGIRPVWSESSLSAWRKPGSLAAH